MKNKEEALHLLIHNLANCDIKKIPKSLFNGSIGISTLLLMYNNMYDNDLFKDATAESIVILQNLVSEQNIWQDSSIDGLLGFILSLHRLDELGIINAPHNLADMSDFGIARYSGYYKNMPIQYNPNDRIYPTGIITIGFCNKEDTIESYFRREKIIHLIRDCEKILTCEIPLIHNPKTLCASHLHSMLSFILEAHNLQLFPYKTFQLIDIISTFDYDISETDIKDIYILNNLLNMDSDAVLNSRIRRDLNSLAYVGVYSFIYRKPIMFTTLLNKKIVEFLSDLEYVKSLPIEIIIGCAFGLISEKCY